ncbi:hypothetical protein [Endozoicomonas sp. 4G]|uniref:hypothetical protein n=1 Tax=Endozoicomonas sp. 4G TaxID=2872754 RepID=UPI002078C32D|nr:hypothetical protein [Endozoicomonas sp. 4G]
MMIIDPHKIIGFSLLFTSLSWGAAVNTNSLPVAEALVEFFPETDSPPCRGVLVSKDLMATSPVCAQKAREHSNDGLIETLTLSGESVGYIAEQPNKSLESSMLLNISLDSETFRPTSYPAFNDSLVQEQAFTYNVNEKKQLVQQSVTLALDETRSKSKFIISSEFSIPQGSPIFDLKNQLVCLRGTGNQCFSASELPIARFRRDLKDYPYDPDDDSDDEIFASLDAKSLGIVLGIAAAIGVAATAFFYLSTYHKARAMGMPARVYWAGILGQKHCGYCDSTSGCYAIVGIFFCAPIFWPLSAYRAATNWIEEYGGIRIDRAPIITNQPQQSAPPLYSQ